MEVPFNTESWKEKLFILPSIVLFPDSNLPIHLGKPKSEAPQLFICLFVFRYIIIYNKSAYHTTCPLAGILTIIWISLFSGALFLLVSPLSSPLSDSLFSRTPVCSFRWSSLYHLFYSGSFLLTISLFVSYISPVFWCSQSLAYSSLSVFFFCSLSFSSFLSSLYEMLKKKLLSLFFDCFQFFCLFSTKTQWGELKYLINEINIWHAKS